MNNYYKYEPVELTFFKFSLQCEDNEKKIQEYYNSYTGAEEGGYDIYDALGMYSYIGIRRKKENISLEAIKSFLDNTNENIKLNFYTYKIAMSHLFSCGAELGLGKHPSAILQLQLKDNSTESIIRGYEQIKEKVAGCGAVYEVYKILGPNDYLIIFKGIRIDKIFEYKTKFICSENSIFRRGNITVLNTTTYTEYINEDLKNIQFVSDIRLKNNIDIFQLKTLIENHFIENKLVEYEIFEALGVIDIKIRWRTKDLQIIKDIFFKLDEYISDEQTDCIRLIQ